MHEEGYAEVLDLEQRFRPLIKRAGQLPRVTEKGVGAV